MYKIIEVATMTTAHSPKIRIAISACLLGREVRYNGGHKESRLCSHTLAQHFDFVPLCPEVAIGLGIPREPIRLVGDPQQPRALGSGPLPCRTSSRRAHMCAVRQMNTTILQGTQHIAFAPQHQFNPCGAGLRDDSVARPGLP